MTDAEIENLTVKCGGQWNGSHWKFEGADLHPFVRTVIASHTAPAAPKTAK